MLCINNAIHTNLGLTTGLKQGIETWVGTTQGIRERNWERFKKRFKIWQIIVNRKTFIDLKKLAGSIKLKLKELARISIPKNLQKFYSPRSTIFFKIIKQICRESDRLAHHAQISNF